MKEYNKRIIPLAKALRKDMTPRERKLWYDFLGAILFAFKGRKLSQVMSAIFIVRRQSL